MNQRFILITGCSGGGKSTLLAALAKRGFATIPEPGRRIVAAELAGAGKALPWVDLAEFARRAIAMARADLLAAENKPGLVFFDRGLVDAAAALQFAGGADAASTLGPKRQYRTDVFLAPPWQDIFAQDAERRHDFEAAVQEYQRIDTTLRDQGYVNHMLPKTTIDARVDFILDTLKAP